MSFRSFHGRRVLLGLLVIRFRSMCTVAALGIPPNQSYRIINAGSVCMTSSLMREEGWLPLLRTFAW
jgi:hypothetical protein